MAKIKHLESKFSIARYELIKVCEPDELKFYLWLKLWAINKHEAWPSYQTIASEMGVTRRGIIKFIQRIEEKGHLKITRKNNQPNIYDITWYDRIGLGEDIEREDTIIVNGRTLGIVNESSPELKEKNEKKKTNKNSAAEPDAVRTPEENKNIATIIDMFKNINPAYKVLFARRPQKEATAWLIDHAGGMDSAIALMEYVVQNSNKDFFPSVLTPFELKMKIGKVKQYYEREKNGQGSGKVADLRHIRI